MRNVTLRPRRSILACLGVGSLICFEPTSSFSPGWRDGSSYAIECLYNIGTVQQAGVSIPNAHDPLFLDIGTRLFIAFATILIACTSSGGRRVGEQVGDRTLGCAKRLLLIAFGYSMIVFYEAATTTPLCGVRYGGRKRGQGRHHPSKRAA